MTNIEQKALELVNEVAVELGEHITDAAWGELEEALYLAIERHEAFRQEVSDAIQSWVDGGIDRPAYIWFRKNLERFIIAKPDPLAEALAECDGVTNFGPGYNDDARVLRAALAKRGLEIREKE